MTASYEGRNRRTENRLRAILFDGPEWTPCCVSLMPATWMKYREDLEELVLSHPRVFPGYRKGGRDFDEVGEALYETGRRVDCWGVTWENVERGLSSYVVGHPLEDWDAFETWTPPDPMKDGPFGPRPEWGAVRRHFTDAISRGDLASVGPLPHGFFYMLLFYLRGFENLMLDLATGEARLEKLIGIVEDYNVRVIMKHLELGAEYLSFGEDLGMQRSLPVSPEMWRARVKPSYEAMLGPCRDAGVLVYLHSDGHVLEIIPDLIEVGVRVLNPQIRANGLAGLVETAKGKVAIDLDLDRQLFPFASPSEIEAHVGEAFEALYVREGPREGGLMLNAECEPDVPLDNIDAVCRALERLCNPPGG